MKSRTLLSSVALAGALTLTACSTGTGVSLEGAGPDGKILYAAIAGEPDQLDPQKTSSYFAFEVLENVFDTLVQPDENLEMQPALAESWEVSDDQLTWTFQLREGVTFHDGSAFTSEDVLYSLNRIIDQELANAWRLSAVESITAPDDFTVEITVTRPTPNLLSSLGGFKGMAIVEEDNAESGDITTKPIGTGPFSLTDSIPAQQVAGLEGTAEVDLGIVPSTDYWYLALNENSSPYDDVRVRQAIGYAIDRDAIAQVTSYGTAEVNQLAIPKQSAWYTEYNKYSTDLDKAQSLLDDAGVGPLELDLLATSDYPETVTAAQVIADNLEPLGITVSIRQPDFATWLDEQNTGNFDMLMMGWLGNIDPDDFYYAQHHSNGSSNAQGYSNPEVDDLLDAGRAETDTDKRQELYAQAATIIADEASYLYLYNPSVIQAWSPELDGYEARGDRAVRFKDVSFSE